MIPQRPARYSDETLDKARELLAVGNIMISADKRLAFAPSLRTNEVYTVAAALDNRGSVLGITCTCANGRKGGLRARCYHAAALELHLNGETA